MNGYLRQSTASQSRLIGPFLDDTDFKTASTGLTIANTDIKVRANGTTLSNKNSGGGTHQVNGMYSLTWDATDTANVGELFYSVKMTGALQVFGSYVVLEEAVYDALFAASALGYVDGATVNATKLGGTTQTGRDIGASVLLSSGTGTGQLDFTSGVVKANVVQSLGTAVTNEDGTIASATSSTITFPTTDSAGNTIPNNSQYEYTQVLIVGGTGLNQLVMLTTATGTARQYNVLSGSMPTQVDGTSKYVILGKWVSNVIYWSGSAVATPVVAGYPRIDVDHMLGATIFTTGSQVAQAFSSFFNVSSPTGTVNSLPAAVPGTLGGVFLDGTNTGAVTLSSGFSIGGNLVVSGTTTLTGAVSAPAGVTANITGNLIGTASAVTVVNGLANNVITAASIATDADTEIASAVWDLNVTGHTNSGTFGAAMNAAGSAGDPWSTPIPGSYASGTAGHIVGTAIPDIAPGSANGLLRSGTNTATTFASLVATTSATLGALTVSGNTTLTGIVSANNASNDVQLGVTQNAATADKILGRNVAGSSDGGRTVAQAVAAMRNKVAFDVPATGQFTVFATDDTTPLWTGTYTASPSASPVTVIDPT